MDKLTNKDKCTYVTIKWSTYERITSETDGDENDTYEEDNYITKCIEHNHVAHFNVNLPVKKFIDKVVPYYQRDLAKETESTLIDTHQLNLMRYSENR